MFPFDNIYIYFFVILGGFMLVRSFRVSMNYKEKLGEFEYLGLSSFWGIVILFVWSIFATKTNSGSINNILEGGVLLTLIGFLLGKMAAWLLKMFKH